VFFGPSEVSGFHFPSSMCSLLPFLAFRLGDYTDNAFAAGPPPARFVSIAFGLISGLLLALRGLQMPNVTFFV